MKVLVIVDMQRQFAAADAVVVAAVLKQIELAKQNGWPVVVLELPEENLLRMVRAGADLCGRPLPVPRSAVAFPATLPAIMQALRGHLHEVRNKYGSDGGLNAVYACYDRGWPLDDFRVVGVNTECCVLATVKGLRNCRVLARIEVVREACNTTNPDEVWSRFPEDVVLIPAAA